MGKRTARMLGAVSALLVVTCSITVDFDPEQDDRAMARIEQLWSDEYEEGVSLVLCEDRVRADMAEEGACGVDHIVKGGGRGSYSSPVRGGNDCSGCPDQAIAYVQGFLGGGALGTQVAVQGVVIFDDYNDPYRLPYTLELQCVDETHPCDVTGQINEGDWLTLSVSRDGTGVPASESLWAQGEAECAGD